MAAQSIKYQTTSIDPAQSAGEIAALVRRYGGSRYEMRWGEWGQLEGIRFAIRDEELGEVPVRLTAQTERIEEILRKARPYSSRSRGTRADYDRDIVEQALLAVETGLFPIGAAFMAHLEVWDDAQGETVTMGEFLGRRAEIEAGGRGLRLAGLNEVASVRRLPPAQQG